MVFMNTLMKELKNVIRFQSSLIAYSFVIVCHSLKVQLPFIFSLLMLRGELGFIKMVPAPKNVSSSGESAIVIYALKNLQKPHILTGCFLESLPIPIISLSLYLHHVNCRLCSTVQVPTVPLLYMLARSRRHIFPSK